ncbi:hypothetical protein GCM10010301_72240 [Streptomyces plicatus]|nr:hypothetical protein GCM10010301_72240 [Streptomyces plicatus]
MTAEGEALVSGMVNMGAVFRRGNLVERPAPRNARALHAYLVALKEHSFNTAPAPVGLTADGREQLTFIPGDVSLPPFPTWAMRSSALESVGSLLRARDQRGRRGRHPCRVAAGPGRPEGGTMLCHNDVCPENVV